MYAIYEILVIMIIRILRLFTIRTQPQIKLKVILSYLRYLGIFVASHSQVLLLHTRRFHGLVLLCIPLLILCLDFIPFRAFCSSSSLSFLSFKITMPSSEHLSDDYVAQLLAKDAKTSNAKYSAYGLQELLPKR